MKNTHAFPLFTLAPWVVAGIALGCGPVHPGGHGGAGGCTGENCAGAGGSAGTGGTGEPVDAGADAADSGLGSGPPPGCLPPCLEDAIRQCVPSFGACLVSEETRPTEPMPTTVKRTCDPLSKWKVVETTSYPLASRTLYKDNAECFSRSTHTRNVGGPALEVTYYSFGTQIATGAELSGTSAVVCGDAGTFRLEPPSPECAAWRALLVPTPTCTTTSPGVCE